MKYALFFLSLPILGLALTACDTTNDATLPPPGQYEETSTRTNENTGTTTQTETSTNVFYDTDGNKKAIVNKKTTTDPEGLFNKKTHESSTLIE